MRVLVNALPLRYGGGTNYLHQQMAALAGVDDTEYHTLLSPWTELANLPGTSERVKVPSVPARFAWEQLRLPFRAADLLYCPANFAPMAARAPIVLTIQNANYYEAGLALDETRGQRPPWKVRANHWAMRRARAVVAISESLAADARRSVPGIDEKLHVILSGAPEWPAESSPVEGLPASYVVSVASSAPHKRVEDVVAGWARSQAGAADPVSLVLVGGHTDEQTAAHRSVAGALADRLVHLGRVGDRASLKWIYEHARAMISMSLLEAFPLTPAEAGSVGCPLVLSDLPAHREVTQGNAHFVPPRDVDALARVLSSAGADAGDERWAPGSKPWRWPVTWADNAAQLRGLFDTVRR